MSPKNPTASTNTKPAAAKNAAAERLKKEALAEIGKRLNAPTATTTPKGGEGAKGSPKDATKRAPAAHGPASAATGAKKPPTPTAKTKEAKAAKPMGALDAAAKVLAESKKPMRAIDIYAEIQTRGMWKTLGKTPEATIYAAMIREIAAKGKDSRFKKTDRGMFTATGKGA